MDTQTALYVTLNWIAVFFYIVATVANVGGTLYLTSYKYSVTLKDTGVYDSAYYEYTNTSGIVQIINKQFSVNIVSLISSTDTLSGIFDTGEMILAGKIFASFGSGTVSGTCPCCTQPWAGSRMS